MTNRPTWESTFLSMAAEVAKRSTCPRLACGALVASASHQVLATGYNGSARGEPHCDEVGCLMEGGHCVRAIHAELNALLQGARVGVSLNGGTLYATHRPCVRCASAIIQAGIAKVVYAQGYDSDGLFETVRTRLTQAGIVVLDYEE